MMFQPRWFDAAEWPEAERRRRFSRTLSDAHLPLEVEWDAALGTYEARLVWCALPGLNLATCFAAGSRLEWTAERAGTGSGCLLLRPVGEPMRAHQGGASFDLAAGEAILLSLARPFRCEVSPRQRLDQMFVSPAFMPAAASAPWRIGAQDPTLQLLVHYGGAILLGHLTLATEPQARMMAHHIRDLLGIMLRPGDEDGAGADGRLASIKQRVGLELPNRALGVELVAQAHGVSARTVQKLFEAEGTTFTSYVLESRLAAARERLLASDESVSGIAFACGFGDLSYFNRVFRRRFGLSPLKLRRQGMAQPAERAPRP